MRTTAQLAATALAIAVCVVPSVGCNGKQESPPITATRRTPPPDQGQPQQQPPQPVPPPQSQALPPAAEPEAAPAQSSPSPGPPPAPRKVGTSGTTGGELGVGDNDVAGVQVVLIDVRRTSGDTLTVKWQYRNTNQDKANVKELYSNEAAKDAYVLDAVNRKRYMVLRDATNDIIAEKHDSSVMDPGQRITSWAKFPAPPPDVTTVTIAIPHVAPFEDVTIR